MELRRLRYFAAVARHLHFGRAAEELGIAQPGLSQQIKLLERELGARLLDRDRRGVALTPAGAVLLTEATALLDQSEALRSRVAAAARGASELLRIAYTRSGSDLAIGDLVRAFGVAYPAVEIETHTGWTSWNLEALVKREIDVAFVRGPICQKELSTIVVAEEEMVIVLASGHPLAQRSEIDRSHLEGEAIVMWPRHQGPEFYDELLDQVWPGSEPNVNSWEPDAEQIMSAVAAGQGLAVLDRRRAIKLCPDGVVSRPFSGNRPVVALRLAYRAADRTAAVGRFVEWISTGGMPRR